MELYNYHVDGKVTIHNLRFTAPYLYASLFTDIAVTSDMLLGPGSMRVLSWVAEASCSMQQRKIIKSLIYSLEANLLAFRQYP